MTEPTCNLKTSIVYNNSSKQFGLPPFYYRYRNVGTNLNGNTPAEQYQRLKLIQNTVRVPSSLYISNKGPLSVYKSPEFIHNNVCWNQMSDRPVPSIQKASVPTGFFNSLNSRRSSVTSGKPGCQTPGGKGCDIKHNSYERYLNRLKGKGVLRRGPIPPTFGEQLPFNYALPIYGGKTVKTNIVSGCNCFNINNTNNKQEKQNQKQDDYKIYNNPLWQEEQGGICGFSIGNYVYAKQTGNDFYTKAIITDIINNVYIIQFDNGFIQDVSNMNELLVYFPCKCDESIIIHSYNKRLLVTESNHNGFKCYLPESLLLGVGLGIENDNN
jgi:hypothetical protein